MYFYEYNNAVLLVSYMILYPARKWLTKVLFWQYSDNIFLSRLVKSIATEVDKVYTDFLYEKMAGKDPKMKIENLKYI